MTKCLHCGLTVPTDSAGGDRFCCHGCRAAYELINDLGLGRYYERRTFDGDAAPLRPDEDAPPVDYAAHVTTRVEADGAEAGVLHLMVEGIHCAACVWLIETVLSRKPGVLKARVNMTTRRLELAWRAGEADPNDLVATVSGLGYRLVPFDPAILSGEDARRERNLLKAMAVAGFAAGNVMLLSVSVWAGHVQGMGDFTRDMMHWLSALIALPAIAYSGVPFFRSGWTALRAGRVNMDVPISVGVLLASGMSLAETIRGGPHAYFDAAITLLFFLLIGRYLERRARGRARSSAEHLLALNAVAATVVEADGSHRLLPPAQIRPGMEVLVAAGERVAVDGTVIAGQSELDTSLITGETVPTPAEPGTKAFAGTVNLGAALRIRVDAAGEGTLLAEIVRLMEASEQGRARYVAIADRVAKHYGPLVHILALGTFAGWMIWGDIGWQQSLLIAVAVLIITCPCALALAVPTVQVIATSRLLRQGILVKSGTALERLAVADRVVFDKTGTLTEGRPELVDPGGYDPDALNQAAAMAASSRHPLSRALVRAVPLHPARENVVEVPGRGLEWMGPDGVVRLGSRMFVFGNSDHGAEDEGQDSGPEMWLARPGRPPVRFAFTDTPRADAVHAVAELKRRGYEIELLSGDREAPVREVAQAVGIEEWRALQGPADKVARLEQLAREGHRVAMVGDGLNDAPALAAAYVSLSPSTAVDVSQTAADLVFQGRRVRPVVEVFEVARRADALVKQNFALALLYNVFTIPIAMAGYVTPLVAAIAMSTSSILVIGNALRLARRKTKGEA